MLELCVLLFSCQMSMEMPKSSLSLGRQGDQEIANARDSRARRCANRLLDAPLEHGYASDTIVSAGSSARKMGANRNSWPTLLSR